MKSEECRRLIAVLSAYLDGEVPDELFAQLEKHLEDCDDCRVVVDTTRKTVELVHDVPQPDLDEDVRERLYDALDLSEWFRPKA